MSASADRLNRSGSQILGAVNSAVGQASVLERQWNPGTAEEARQNLCSILEKLHADNLFWSDLAKPVAKTLNPAVVDGLWHMDLDEFEEFEIRTFSAAGLDRDLARQWAREASHLLFVVRLGFDSHVPVRLRPSIGETRASVKLAHQRLCTENPGLTNPAGSKGKGWKNLSGHS